ncbi:MAG: hypothetical protein KF723_18215 [Rhizobiaceae bacterium]|nr:hypothetical protein [Rhizobiaceae bacterium]
MRSGATPEEFAARSAAILAHPRFAEARQVAIDRYLALYSGTPALNKLLIDGSKHVVIMFAVCLAAGQREDEPETWLTLAKLQDVVSTLQVGSPGLVEAIVGRMIDSGLIATASAPRDRRKKLLVPTEALIRHDLDMLAAFAEPCTVLGSHPAFDLAMVRDRGMQRACRIFSVSEFARAFQTLMKHAEMMNFFQRDSGYLVLLAFLQSALSSPDGLISTVLYKDIAERFGVSRAHVRNMVEDAEAAGLMRTLEPGGAGVELLPDLMEKHDRYFADCTVLVEQSFVVPYETMIAGPQ